MHTYEGIDRFDYEEKYHQCHDQEADHGVQEGPDLEFTVVEGKSVGGEVNIAKDTDQGSDKVGDKSIDDSGESRTNDDTDSKVDDVATQDKLLKIVQRASGTTSNLLHGGVVPH